MSALEHVPGPAFPFRFGVGLPTNGPFARPEIIFAIADRAEALGLDDVWVNDHIDFPASRLWRSSAGTLESAMAGQVPNYFESLTTVALLAGRLRRIGVGAHGIILPLRDPRIFAKQVATIHELSGRRLTISPGIGAFPKDFEVMQVPFEQRGRLLDEHLAAIHAIFNDPQPVSFEGRSVRFTGATLYPVPSGLRLWVTGESEPAWRRVVRWAGGWFTSYPAMAEYRPKLARLRQLAVEAGRDPDRIDAAATCFVCIGRTREAALELCGPTLVQRFKSMERAFEVAAIGTAEEVGERLAERYRSGLRYLEIKFMCRTSDDLLEMMERLATEVLPPLRRLA